MDKYPKIIDIVTVSLHKVGVPAGEYEVVARDNDGDMIMTSIRLSSELTTTVITDGTKFWGIEGLMIKDEHETQLVLAKGGEIAEGVEKFGKVIWRCLNG